MYHSWQVIYKSHCSSRRGISQECLLGADFQVKHKSVIELDKSLVVRGK